MAVTSVRISTTAHGIRPVDPLRDLPAIVELIETGFHEELDPQGWKMLKRMRRAAERSWWTWLTGEGWAPNGFVWVEQGRIVGNLSLRRAHARRPGGSMIGNVVVHPDFQGQGIGRALMEMALKTARSEHGRWVGLEVRADNAVARGLYERLGFRAVGQTEHLLRPAGLPWPDRPMTERWRSSQPADDRIWLALADQIYPQRQADVLEIRTGAYLFGGWEHWLDLWLAGEREGAWLRDEASPQQAVRVRTDRRYRFHSWDLLVHPASGAVGAQAAVARALAATRRFPSWPVVTLADPQPALLAELAALGFRPHRTLVQMVLDL